MRMRWMRLVMRVRRVRVWRSRRRGIGRGDACLNACWFFVISSAQRLAFPPPRRPHPRLRGTSTPAAAAWAGRVSRVPLAVPRVPGAHPHPRGSRCPRQWIDDAREYGADDEGVEVGMTTKPAGGARGDQLSRVRHWFGRAEKHDQTHLSIGPRRVHPPRRHDPTAYHGHEHAGHTICTLTPPVRARRLILVCPWLVDSTLVVLDTPGRELLSWCCARARRGRVMSVGAMRAMRLEDDDASVRGCWRWTCRRSSAYSVPGILLRHEHASDLRPQAPFHSSSSSLPPSVVERALDDLVGTRIHGSQTTRFVRVPRPWVQHPDRVHSAHPGGSGFLRAQLPSARL
ncbi:hypothetical protein C8R46DRAFT_649927 [Mycena filopes]|nr:hypothetical protein C8R46DRAFT_649927 [Mycena filopes]